MIPRSGRGDPEFKSNKEFPIGEYLGNPILLPFNHNSRKVPQVHIIVKSVQIIGV